MSCIFFSTFSLLDLALISIIESDGESSKYIGSIANFPIPAVILFNSVFDFLAIICLVFISSNELNILIINCLASISSEKKAIGICFIAAFIVIESANAVFPIEGRAARIHRSDFCSPPFSIWSRNVNPVVTPPSVCWLLIIRSINL
ncbi:hypothetical protein SDC9_187522 [bioreactor metagenome]|uniref:Uncharacterized protein n=1 Tax=bioreactor metagenome TaxID=1076179 RepID=A0A645HM30_9ZZZZ